MPNARADRYINKAYIDVTESAANTLTFLQLTTGVSLFEKTAFVVHQIRYAPVTSSTALVVADGDVLNMAITTSNSITTLVEDDPNVVDLKRLAFYDAGTAATGFFYEMPFVNDFSNLPGGGLIIPASPIYGAINGSSLASATQVRFTIFFTAIQLSPSDYWELVEATRVIT